MYNVAQDRTRALPNRFLPHLRRLHQEELNELEDPRSLQDHCEKMEEKVETHMPAKAGTKANQHDSRTKPAARKSM